MNSQRQLSGDHFRVIADSSRPTAEALQGPLWGGGAAIDSHAPQWPREQIRASSPPAGFLVDVAFDQSPT